MKTMWRITPNKFLLVLALLAVIHAKTQTNIDRIVAIIGDKIILHSEVLTQMKQAQQEGANLGANPYCTVLEENMFQKLLVHQADVDSLVVKDEQVEQELNQRIAYFIAQIGSKEKFEAYYGKSTEKFKEDFRDAIRDRMKAQQMQSKSTSDIKVTPKEIVDFYNKIPKDSLPFIGSKIEVAHLVMMPKVSTDEKLRVKKKLDEYRTDILSGKESFCVVATLESEDPGTRNNCGEFELVPRGTFVPEFDAVAFTLKEGQISEVFETQYGFHILQLLERRGDMYRGRHILMSPKISNLQMAKASQKMDSIYNLIRTNQMTFEDAVKKFSTDDETRQNQGKLFNQQTGDTKFETNEVDKQLFITVDKMNPGDISEPVYMTTPDQKQGIRIVKLLSRSDPHVANLKDDYPQISEAALGEKKNRAVLKWVRSKTGTMYVWIEEDAKTCSFEYPWMKNQ